MTNVSNPAPQRNNQRQFAENRRQVILQAARAYLERGWKPVPVPAGQKNPNHLNWQLEAITLDNYRSKFKLFHHNIGVQHGSPSNGLCDVDLDCREARDCARYFLPDTGAIFGRASTPDAHWLYRSDLWETAATAVTAFDDPINPTEGSAGEHGVRLIELRTGRIGDDGAPVGAQSLFPPSVHPSGEAVCWTSGGEPGEPTQIDGSELRAAVAMTAAATLLVRHYPPDGKRHEAALVLGGWLARAGWDEEQIAYFMEAVANTAGDPECQERINSAKSAARRLADGEHVAGKTRMRAVFGKAIVDTLAKWLEIGDGAFAGEASDNPAPEQSRPRQPRTVEEVVQVFRRWLVLRSATPVYAMLGAVAANELAGEPVWLGLVGTPSSAKTELLISTTQLPKVVKASTMTMPALLSGTPKRQRERDAKGGLLRQIGEQGLLVLKDFGSVLTMRPDARAEMLQALRDIYDGNWDRHLGTDGGKSLTWQGKIGLLFGVTPVIDQHYSVMGAMGDRFLLCRFAPTRGQFRTALKHSGAEGRVMREQLRDAVTDLFAGERREPRALSASEENQLSTICDLVVRLRGAVIRDGYSREIEAVYGEEGTGRLGLMLERLLAGLDMIGVDRKQAFDVVRSVALDSVPQQRRQIYEYLRFGNGKDKSVGTREIADGLLRPLPTKQVRYKLEELAAYGVVKRGPFVKGREDVWWTGPWGNPPLQQPPRSRRAAAAADEVVD